jgi:predicted nucleic acid-binding Zn ribbon protein
VLAFGIAICTLHNVFVFCEETQALRDRNPKKKQKNYRQSRMSEISRHPSFNGHQRYQHFCFLWGAFDAKGAKAGSRREDFRVAQLGTVLAARICQYSAETYRRDLGL